MHIGDLINEETIVPGGKKPAGSPVQSHYPAKIGVPEGGFATQTVAGDEEPVNSK